MTRDDYISYCSVCVNRHMTDEDEIICNLTHNFADFKNSCSSFKIDSERKKILISKYKIDIEESIQNQSSLIHRLTDNKPILKYLVESKNEKESNNDRLETEIIISESPFEKTHFLIYGLFFIGIIGIAIYEEGLDFNNYKNLSIFSFSLLISLFFLFNFLKNGVIFRISKIGITLKNNELITWNRINYIHYKIIETSRGSNENYLILRMHKGFGADRKIELNYANIGLNEIGEITYRYLNTFKVN